MYFTSEKTSYDPLGRTVGSISDLPIFGSLKDFFSYSISEQSTEKIPELPVYNFPVESYINYPEDSDTFARDLSDKRLHRSNIPGDVHRKSPPESKQTSEKISKNGRDTLCSESKERVDHKVNPKHYVHKSQEKISNASNSPVDNTEDTRTGGSHNEIRKMGRDNAFRKHTSIKPRSISPYELYKHNKGLQDQILPDHDDTLSPVIDKPGDNVTLISRISVPQYHRNHNGTPNQVSKNYVPDSFHEVLHRIVEEPHINRTKLQDPVLVLVSKDNSSEEQKTKTTDVLTGQILSDDEKHSSLKGRQRSAEEPDCLTQKKTEVFNRNISADDGSVGYETPFDILSKTMKIKNQKERDTDALENSFDQQSKFNTDRPDNPQKEHSVKAREGSRDDNIQIISSNITMAKNAILPGYGETVRLSTDGIISVGSEDRVSERPEGNAHEHQNASFLDDSLHTHSETTNISDDNVSKTASVSRSIPDDDTSPNVENYTFRTIQNSTVDIQRDARQVISGDQTATSNIFGAKHDDPKTSRQRNEVSSSEEIRHPSPLPTSYPLDMNAIMIGESWLDDSILNSDNGTTFYDTTLSSDANTTAPSFDNTTTVFSFAKSTIFDNHSVLSALDTTTVLDDNITTSLDDNSTYSVAYNSMVFLNDASTSEAAFSRIENKTGVPSDNSAEFPAYSTNSSFGNNTTVPTYNPTNIRSNMDIPDSTIYILDNSTSSDNNTHIPDKNIPDHTAYIPDNTTYIPDKTTSIPDNTTSIPDNTTYSPNITTHIPDSMISITDNTTYAPGNTNIPDNTTYIPDSTTYAHDKDSRIPNSTTYSLHNNTNILDNITSISDNTTYNPDNTPDIPDNNTDFPNNITYI